MAGTDRALTGLAGQVADQVSDDIFLDKSGTLGSVRYNRAAFAPPALGTYGNAGFFSVPGIGTWTLDAALSRQFRWRQGGSRLRLEAFNVTNAVRAIDPTATITNVNFGRITERAGAAHHAVRVEVRVLNGTRHKAQGPSHKSDCDLSCLLSL